MSTDPFLLNRLRNILQAKHVVYNEKKMFGGHCFMVDDKMCFGTYKGGLMARVAHEEIELLARKQGAEAMIHAGRPMKGYLFIEADGYDDDTALEFWIRKCLEFNPLAKASKKKSKKK